MKLDVNPLVALCDQKIEICVSGLPAYGQVKISASLRYPWAEDVLFESAACFTADAQGRVDLSRQKPEPGGSYDFIDSMGLIVSLHSQDPRATQKIVQGISVDHNLHIDIVAECGQERASAHLERMLKGQDIQRLRISDEFVGELYYSENTSRKTIIWLGGSGSNLEVNAPVAALLASHGFNVLAVSYFSDPGLPAQLSEVPLEYFDKVFAWLAKSPITRGKEIRILGMSKGAELALLLASRNPFITRVVVWAPHAYCFQGIAFKNVSSWTYAGKSLPFIRIKNRWIFADALDCFIKNKHFGFTTAYKKALSVAENKDAARIKIEAAQADLMLFTSKDCGMWNTYDGSLEIMDTLRKCNYPHAYQMVVYEDTGEPYYAPNVFPATETTMKMAPRLVLDMGGTLQGNAHAKEDAWLKTIEFLGQPSKN
ncbi:MAG: acyl-CoA thioester hydrolase/BAAT C-terminal domain-containing protein [Anaerolineaceae bacterium]|nr:acyl-CoA thioester hydrolase/BAAT C-terminal domain-containing protein [Anaerolineaceae bacterium]